MAEPETPKEERERHLKELQGRNVAHYQVLLTGWIQTRMELDKTFVTFSSAGIGLLVTLAVVYGVRNEYEFAAVVLGLLTFLLCIMTCLILYKLNSAVLAAEITNNSVSRPKLKAYDILAQVSFFVALICLSVMQFPLSFTGSPTIEVRPCRNPKLKQ